jgi:mRNA-degrading endonuclease RelE of RelBE toxin-antitoxin system
MFRVVIHPDAFAELTRVPAFHRVTILDTMRTLLSRDPMTARRSRVKKMKGPFWPPYRLRVGDFRVYYDVDESRREVLVLHIWEKGRTETQERIEPTAKGGRRRKR